MKSLSFVLLAVILVVSPIVGRAQIPRTISYQGVLSDTAGYPKKDSTYSITFRLYQASSGGSAIWTETKSLTTKRGLFSTQLGDVTPFGPSGALGMNDAPAYGANKVVADDAGNGVQSTTNLSFDKKYWMSIQVGSDPELSPRTPLSSVPYSIRSIKADTAAYSLSGGGSSQWTTNGSNIYYSSGNVGIGRSDPFLRLHTSSAAAKTATGFNSIALFSSSDAANPIGLSLGFYGGTNSAQRKAALQGTEYGLNLNDLLLQPLGFNVGIGTTTPNATLDVVSHRATAASFTTDSAQSIAGNFNGKWIGVNALATGQGPNPPYGDAIGIQGEASGSAVGGLIGVRGQVYGAGPSQIQTGVKGFAIGGGLASYGIYGENSGSGTNDYAGYFSGKVKVSSSLDVSGTVKMTGFNLNSGSSLNGKVLTSDASGIGSWQTSTVSSPPFSDASALMKNSADATKLLSFNLSGITAGTTRTLTVPNANTTLVGTDVAQTLTNKTITGTTNTVAASQLRTTGPDVVVSSAAAPTAGQVLTATSGTVAAWQTPASLWTKNGSNIFYNSGNVGIGTTTPVANRRLDVRAAGGTGIEVLNSGNVEGMLTSGIYSLAQNGSDQNFGVWGIASGGTIGARGLSGFAYDGTVNYGVYGEIPDGSPGYAGYFKGPLGVAGDVYVDNGGNSRYLAFTQKAGLNYGLYFDYNAGSLSTWTNTLPRITVANDGNVGIGTTTPTAKLTLTGGEFLVDNGGSSRYLAFTQKAGTNYGLYFDYAAASLTLWTNSAPRFTIANNGTVTINGEALFNGGLVVASDVTIGSLPAPKTLGVTGTLNVAGMINVAGQVNVTGQVCAVNVPCFSDSAYKKSVTSLTNTLKMIKKLRGVTYEWKREEFPEKAFQEGRQIGFIAQEVERVLPELVHTDVRGYKSLSYDKLTAVLVEAIKEQNRTIEMRTTELEEIKARLARIESALTSSNANGTVKLARDNQP